MDAINRTLLISLKQEVKTLNEIVNELPAVNCREEVRSWLFPSKPYQFVNEFIYGEDILELDNFKSYLELIIDRLYVGIRLILDYIEEKCVKEQKDIRFIHRPKLISLGFSFQRLWQAVRVLLSQDMSTNMVKETTTGEDNFGAQVSNKEIQTNITSLNKCDSCSSAMLCMKNLLHSFNKNEFKIPQNERRLLRPKVFDITQFGCMLQTTTAVEKGVNTLYEKLFVKVQEGEALQRENQELRSEIIEKDGKITFLQRQTEILKEKCEKDNRKISLLNNQNDELCQMKDKQQSQIKTLNEVINNLNKSIRGYSEKIVKLAYEKENLSSSTNRIKNDQLSVVKFSMSLQSKLSSIEKEHLLIENSFNALEETVDNVNTKVKRITDDLVTAGTKLSKVSEGGGDVVSLLESRLKEAKKSLNKDNQEESINTSVRSQKSSFQIKGNPVEDLTRQIEENNEAIKKMENDNIKLKCIVSKLNCLKK